MDLIPNLFLVGAMKAGTTALAEKLATHPDIFMPEIKEPNFFFPEIHSSHTAVPKAVLLVSTTHHAYLRDIAEYLGLYKEASDRRLRLDASTNYMTSPTAPAAISQAVPGAKIILMTRDPVARAWSEYTMHLAIGRASPNFRDALQRERDILSAGSYPVFEQYASSSLYEEHAERFRAYFSEDAIFCGAFEEMRDAPEAFFARLSEFLDIGEIDYAAAVSRNEAKVARFPVANRLLHRSGVKTIISRTVGVGVKESLKKVFYSGTRAEMPTDFAVELGKSINTARDNFVRIWGA